MSCVVQVYRRFMRAVLQCLPPNLVSQLHTRSLSTRSFPQKAAPACTSQASEKEKLPALLAVSYCKEMAPAAAVTGLTTRRPTQRSPTHLSRTFLPPIWCRQLSDFGGPGYNQTVRVYLPLQRHGLLRPEEEDQTGARGA